MSNEKIDDIPWVEKYRPKTLDDVIGQVNIVKRLKLFVNDSEMTHLLFTGPAGTGKTTCANALIRDIQKNLMKNEQTYLELNASDARGINVIRTKVKDFAKGMTPNGIKFKILVLDEFDSSTTPAQQALRRIMEDYGKNCRMILICNYSNKIIIPIQSRCGFMRFSPITDKQMKARLRYIALKEDIIISDEGLDAIIYICNGDLRRGINYLQACSAIDKKIDPSMVFTISGQLKSEAILKMLNFAISGDFNNSFALTQNFINENGVSARNIIRQALKETDTMEISEELKIKISKILGDTEQNLSEGCTEKIQIGGMIAKLSNLVKK